MNRCAHGVYLPKWAKDGSNPYCSCCSNFGSVPRPKDVVLPRSSGHRLTRAGQEFANGFDGGCPDCGSTIFVRVTEKNPANRECADCGRKYKVKLRTHQQAQQLLAEMEQECLE
jgi:hypothetical protein